MAQTRLLIFLLLVSLPWNVLAQEEGFSELKSQRTRQLCAHFLDGYLCLSQEQHLAMEELLKRNWTDGMNRYGRHLLWAGYYAGNDVFDSLDSSELAEFLTEGQIRQYESLSEHGLNQTDQVDFLQGRNGEVVDPIKPTLALSVELELQRTKQLLDLDAEQVRILRIAAKGAAKNVLTERQVFREQPDSLRGSLFGNQRIRIAVECPAFRIRESKIWNRTLKRVLTEQQFAAHLKI